jgi:hypothetical protein
MWYHSSEDTPNKQDPTQYKRAAAVGLGSLAVLSEGTDAMAARVVAENLGRGLSRMGESHTKGLGYMADATDAAALTNAYREARVAILHQARIEKEVVKSASVLWTNTAEGAKRTAAFAPLIDGRATALLAETKAAYQLQAAQRGVPAAEPVMSAEDKAIADLQIELVAGASAAAPGPRGAQPAGAAAGPTLPDEFNAEFALLLRKGGMTVGELRDFLSGEFTPLPLKDVLAVLRVREAQGAIKLTPKPAARR